MKWRSDQKTQLQKDQLEQLFFKHLMMGLKEIVTSKVIVLFKRAGTSLAFVWWLRAIKWFSYRI